MAVIYTLKCDGCRFILGHLAASESISMARSRAREIAKWKHDSGSGKDYCRECAERLPSRSSEKPSISDPLPPEWAIYAALKVYRNHITSERMGELDDHRAVRVIEKILNMACHVEAAHEGGTFGLKYEYGRIMEIIGRAQPSEER